MFRAKAKPERTAGKRRGRTIGAVFAVLAVLLVVVLALTVLTPYPISYLTRFLFRNGPATPPAGFEAMRQTVNVYKDLEYPSEFMDNKVD